MRRIVFGALGLLVFLLLGVASYFTDGGSEPSSVAPTPTSQPSAAATAETDPEVLVNNKQAQRDVIENFVAAYYSRDRDLLSGSVEEQTARYHARLSPFVTEGFLTTFMPPLTTPQDKAVWEESGTVTARVQAFGIGHMHDATEAELEVTIRLVVAFPGETTIVRKLDVVVYLSKEDDEWIVEAFEEVYT